MQQQRLPIIGRRFRLILILTSFSIAVIALLTVSVFAFILFQRRDLIAGYFPANTLAYAGIKLTENNIENIELDLFLPEFAHEQTRLFLKEHLDFNEYRNVGIGMLTGLEGDNFVVMLAVDELPPDEHPLYAMAQSSGFVTYKVTQRFLGKRYVVFAQSEEVAERMNERLNGSTAGLRQELREPIDLINSSVGFLHVKTEILDRILPVEAYQSLLDNQIEHLSGKIEVYDGTIVIVSDGYSGSKTLKIPDFTDQGVVVSRPYGRWQSGQGSVKTRSLAHALRLDSEGFEGVDMISYFIDSEDERSATIIDTDKLDHVSDAVRMTLVEYLSVKHRQTRKVVLPDGTEISEVVKNRDAVSIEESEQSWSLQDLVGGDSYALTSQDDALLLTKNMNESAEWRVVDGCRLDMAADATIFKGIFDKKMMISTYPHTYPQFLLCIW